MDLQEDVCHAEVNFHCGIASITADRVEHYFAHLVQRTRLLFLILKDMMKELIIASAKSATRLIQVENFSFVRIYSKKT
jgi:alpha-D-ribose 1-methylphosphonate 5-triphosphate synthase subunit PhnH